MEATYRIISAKQVNVQFVINMKSRGWRGVKGGRNGGVSQVTQKYIFTLNLNYNYDIYLSFFTYLQKMSLRSSARTSSQFLTQTSCIKCEMKIGVSDVLLVMFILDKHSILLTNLMMYCYVDDFR